MNLSEVEIGSDAIITKVIGRGTFRKRIMEMGFVKGKHVHVVKKAPFNDPIEYEIMGYHVSLRRSESKMIEVVTMEHIAKSSLEEGNHELTFEQLVENELKDHGNVINVGLVGNPNCGKTTFYNFASGSKERVGNYSGVTVDAKTAKFVYKDYIFNITDLPGTYSLTAYSAEELYVRRFITEQSPDIIINMLDASNLERNMYLTTQLIDMDVKVVAALNMYDELEARGDKLDYVSLGRMLGIPFVPVISNKGKGFGVLFDSIINIFEDKSSTYRHIHINYGNDIEKSIKNIQDKIYQHNDNEIFMRIPSRFMALKLLEKDSEIERIVLNNSAQGSHTHGNSSEAHIDEPSCIINQTKIEIKNLEAAYNADTESVITDIRYGFINGALAETLKIGNVNTRKFTDKIDKVITHKFLGFPIFLFVIFMMFEVTFIVGQYPMDWIGMFVDWLGGIVKDNLDDGMLKDLLVDGIIGGVGGVIVFLPNIVLLFMFISFMEDSGYMARVAFLMDKIMHKIGLHGKSFIPLIMGFGCNVPSVMATRTLENRSDRLLTMMISPYMSCSARLPLYTVIVGAFFAQHQAIVTTSVYAIGIFVACLTAILLRKTTFKSQDAPFVMELPPYRIPTLKSVLVHMWEKSVQYLKKMGGIILIASIIIWALGYFPMSTPETESLKNKMALLQDRYDSKIANLSDETLIENTIKERDSILTIKEAEYNYLRQECSYIGRIGKFVEPVLQPLGFNWKLGISIFTGIAAKEIVVSTMGVLYHSETDDTQSLAEKISNDKTSDLPLTPYAAFGFMIFVLIYFPCIATAVAMAKESGTAKWVLISVAYSITIAWLLAFAINSIGKMF